MAVFLDRVDAAPVTQNDFPNAFNQWLAVTVDTLNEDLGDIQDLFNKLPAPQYSSAEITALELLTPSLQNGVILFDVTIGVYVGKIGGSLVKFTTTAYP